MERRQDITTGLAFALLGAAVWWLAQAYRGATGTYPAVLGAVLAGLGLVVAGRAWLRGRATPRPLVDNPLALALTVGIAALYIWAVTRIGFFTASAALMLTLPPVLGLRRLRLTLLATALFVAGVYAVFTLVLQKPLPPDPWHPSRWSALGPAMDTALSRAA